MCIRDRCTRLLVKAGADINRPTPEGVTPVMNAIDNNGYETVSYTHLTLPTSDLV